ncbi:MAG: hypothetical protein A2934_01480 [Candidatus Sungbacteria bacterium RIFCSPLOWO2_01_FULL_47_10]|uniref:Adenylate kinase n=1 Tax=Candidatus Sungbacteria bacterium RIFCSPLOWO2_01_FULL_47_10 TaxID=1802276 RepID=A0A1G2L802_9BACT|nr:MAG: hypothetical protein A2934_01480 [Candidatus Sungbacteria bacterium RIFCSPLOWO2_01_FULL_47_10]
MKLPRVVIFFGLPGSGKGTQADLFSQRYGFKHFDTGKEIERTVHDPELEKNAVIKRERIRFDTGLLNTPSWVKKLINKRVRKYLNNGQRLVFSGSPRTLPESKTLYEVFRSLVGKKAVNIFFLDIDEETSIHRNSHRRVCKDCRTPIIWSRETKNLNHCPLCGGKLVKRSLDKSEIIKERIREFRKKTEPAMKYLEGRGIVVMTLDGALHPDVVARRASDYMK